MEIINKQTLSVFVATVIFNFTLHAQGDQIDHPVKVAGAMRNVMWEGKLSGVIDIDTISGRKQLYGIGPVEYLTGEILIADGKAYKATVVDDTTMRVEETFEIKAPFFVYAQVSRWKEQLLPDSVQNLVQMEAYISKARKNTEPFAFRVVGEAETASIHIVNLPKGTKVNAPDDVRIGQVDYILRNEEVMLVGFYSTQHQGIFTHHDSFIHIHLLTASQSKLGHLDQIKFRIGSAKLYLPE